MKSTDDSRDGKQIPTAPAGRNVVIGLPDGRVITTNDGATIVHSIHLDDPIADMGAQLICTASSAAHSAAGDGTTTATVLAEAFIALCLRHIASGEDCQTVAARLRGLADCAAGFVAGGISASTARSADRPSRSAAQGACAGGRSVRCRAAAPAAGSTRWTNHQAARRRADGLCRDSRAGADLGSGGRLGPGAPHRRRWTRPWRFWAASSSSSAASRFDCR
ncbi:TCP-1/cpn60 chaperonin family protein [Pseudoclavibacter sp. CFCC 11306]|uniref:TCP-1/cpn60 chaperonin family protein n=1 Tax=Pseudoclavibacter sp. CFCC 11306 TaxID=1564493 RepID=UPI0013012A7C|nr:hypothetical protein F8O09_02610 [Pseudoclavibacter sp. CFCC 11306]